jgi:hypothetical protein
MYAIIETGGKQYRAEPQGLLQIESIEGDTISPDRSGAHCGDPNDSSGFSQRRNCSPCSNTIHYGFQNETPQGVSSNQGTSPGFHPSSDY